MIDALSDRAKAVCGAWFGMMKPGKGELTFGMREARPSDEAQQGLDELVRRGIVSVEQFNRYGGLVYRPLVPCFDAFRWLAKNTSNPAAKVQMTVMLQSKQEARVHEKAALSVGRE